MQRVLGPNAMEQIHQLVVGVEGWMTRREIEFLATAAAYPTAAGTIVELGAYQGKSTIVLAQAARRSADRRLVTVEPLYSKIGSILEENLAKAGVVEDVEIRSVYSDEFVATWSEPIRLLFHDGACKPAIVRQDVKSLRPHFADGAMIAMHDVLNASGFRAEVFADEVLNSDHFGPVGCCGSIGWGQYFADPTVGIAYRPLRARLRSRLTRLLPLLGKEHSRWERIRYKYLRSRIPHRRVGASSWLPVAA